MTTHQYRALKRHIDAAACDVSVSVLLVGSLVTHGVNEVVMACGVALMFAVGWVCRREAREAEKRADEERRHVIVEGGESAYPRTGRS